MCARRTTRVPRALERSETRANHAALTYEELQLATLRRRGWSSKKANERLSNTSFTAALRPLERDFGEGLELLDRTTEGFDPDHARGRR